MFKGLIRGGLLFLLLVGNVEAQSSVSFLPNGSLTGVTSTGTSTIFSTPILLPSGSSSAPALSWAASTNTGIYQIAPGYMSFVGSSLPTAGISSGLFQLAAASSIGWAPATLFGASSDLILARDAANTLALRNGTNAQTFNIYNTYTDASNWERASIGWSADIFTIGVDNSGTGAASRTIVLNADGPAGTVIQRTGGGQGTILGNGGVFYYFAPENADTNTLGYVAGAQSWRELFLSRSIQGSKSKSLTDAAAAVSIWRIAVPTNGYAGGKVIFTANSTDGTDRLTTTGEVTFAGADTAGTVTCGIGTPYGLVTAYRRANTLVCTFTAVTSTTNCDIQVTCTDNLAGVQTMAIESRLDMPTPNTVTPQ